MGYEKERITYKVILAAKSGDTSAMKEILAHYDAYIDYHSCRTLYDENGTPYTYFDEDIKARIQAKLLQKVVSDFDPTKLSTQKKNATIYSP